MDHSLTHTLSSPHLHCAKRFRPRPARFQNEPLHSVLVVNESLICKYYHSPSCLNHSSFIACTCPYDWQVWIFRCLENVTNAREFVFNPPTVLSSHHPMNIFTAIWLLPQPNIAQHSWAGIATETIRNKEILVPGIVHCFKVSPMFSSLANGWLVHSRQCH